MDGRLCLPRMAYPGVLLTFCGVDGSGKSTLLAAAADMARDAGRAVHPTRVPPQWSRQAPLVRQFLTTRSGDHAAAAHGEAVLCDRYVFHALALADAMGNGPRNWR